MELEQWINVLETVAFIALPVLLFIELYIGHVDYKGFFEKCGFGRREVGLLLVGGLVGTVLSLLGLYAVPLIIYQGSLLAIDIGGAIIPVVLSIYLVKIKKLDIALFTGVVVVIGIVTYSITEFRPSIGIVAEFPYYLFPSFCAIGLALLIYREKITSGIPFAYATTTFGVLIGADIVRIPQVLIGLEEIREEMDLPIAAGSIGGAGGLDLVFLGGLIAIAPLFFLAPRAIRHSNEEISPQKAFSRNIESTIIAAERMLQNGQLEGAFENAKRAVDMKITDIGNKFNIHQSSYITLDMLSVHPLIRNDYWLLVNTTSAVNKTPNEVYRAIITARHIIREIEKVERRLFASSAQRIVAFLVDMVFVAITVILLFYIGGIVGLYDLTDILAPENFIWFIAFTMWLWVAQMVYFTIFEGFFGHTPGKKIVGIKVTTDELARCGLMDAFTRNVVRILDMALFIYAVSLIFMSIYPRRQRIGDMVAKTVVIKTQVA